MKNPNQFCFPLLVQIGSFISFLVLNNSTQFLIIFVDLKVLCLLLPLLDQVLKLVNDVVLLAELEVELPDFFLDILHSAHLCFLLLFFLVVISILVVPALLGNKYIVFIDIVKFSLHAFLGLLKDSVFVSE